MSNIKIDVNDKIYIKEALATATFSGDKQIGLSVIDDEREFSSQRENNVHGEQAKIKTSARMRKEEQELQVAYRLLPYYNKFHNTDYNHAENIEQHDSIDIICSGDSKSHPNLNLQIRVSDDEAIGTLLKQKSFSRGGTGSEIFSRACIKAIDEKGKKYSLADKANIILALDGWPVVYQQDLEVFKTTFDDYLKKTGFKEIWFVGWSDSLIVKLY